MTKLDQDYAKAVREAAATTQDAVSTLINEVERLEGVIERVARILDPHCSENADVEWLAENYVQNARAQPSPAPETKE